MVDKIPVIAAQFAFQVFQKALRPIKMQVFGTPQTKPQQAIKAAEVVHVGMGDETMGDFEDVPG